MTSLSRMESASHGLKDVGKECLISLSGVVVMLRRVKSQPSSYKSRYGGSLAVENGMSEEGNGADRDQTRRFVGAAAGSGAVGAQPKNCLPLPPHPRRDSLSALSAHSPTLHLRTLRRSASLRLKSGTTG